MDSIEKEYVVLDVETNGLSSTEDDILSITIYRPDNGMLYNRFLPLIMNPRVRTTRYNGIKTKDLEGTSHITQNEADEIIRTFELHKRTILIYTDFDEKFIKRYFQRRGLWGTEKMCFYNFKKDIFSSRYSGGNVTKDNLCRIFGIGNIREIHSGENDCKLEWELFKQIYGKKLLITDDKVFEINHEYIVPVSYLQTHNNLRDYVGDLPDILVETEVIKTFEISGEKMQKFDTNITGCTIEHLINVMLNVKPENSFKFLLENKKKLKFLGELPPAHEKVDMLLNSDGTVSIPNRKHAYRKLEKSINDVQQELKRKLVPVIEFIADEIFHGEKILSQELMVHSDKKILALCDLSTVDAVLEIKTGYKPCINIYSDQLYYTANGRKCYILQMDWKIASKRTDIIISSVTFSVTKRRHCSDKMSKWDAFQNKINNKDIVVKRYFNIKAKTTLECKVCHNQWETSCDKIIRKPICPFCNPESKGQIKRHQISEKEKGGEDLCNRKEGNGHYGMNLL